MKLFLIHVGFYDCEIMQSLYEQHSNYFIVANNIKDAIKKAKQKPIFKKKKMHIDGIHEINSIDGFCVKLIPQDMQNDSVIYNYKDIKKMSD